jgi:hypothetical protein
MKRIIKLTIVLFALSLTACKDDPSATEVKTKMLTATTWGHAQVTHTDGDLSNQYANFAIAFTKSASDGFDGTFIISGGGYAFSETTGRWRFSDNVQQIIFDSGKQIDIELTKANLKLDFTVPLAGGKVKGVSGHFVFELSPL